MQQTQKNKKNKKIMFLLLALITALVVGVVWAIGAGLAINGTAVYEGDVVFTNVATSSTTSSPLTPSTAIGNNTATLTFHITFTALNTPETVTFKLLNRTNAEVEIDAVDTWTIVDDLGTAVEGTDFEIVSLAYAGTESITNPVILDATGAGATSDTYTLTLQWKVATAPTVQAGISITFDWATT